VSSGLSFGGSWWDLDSLFPAAARADHRPLNHHCNTPTSAHTHNRWERFKPTPLPPPDPPPTPPPLQLPQYQDPSLPSDVNLPPPDLLPVPPAPKPFKEQPEPEFSPPPEPALQPFSPPELLLPPVPLARDPPPAPVFGNPKHGYDWSGSRPFKAPRPAYVAPKLPPEPPDPHSSHAGVEAGGGLSQSGASQVELQIEATPVLVLTFPGDGRSGDGDGDGDEHLQELAATAATLKEGSPGNSSMPAAAAAAARTTASRPASASSSKATAAGAAAPVHSRPTTASSSSAGSRCSRPLSHLSFHQLQEQWSAAARCSGDAGAVTTGSTPAPSTHSGTTTPPFQHQTAAAAADDPPRVLLNFAAPFAEPPPIELPPKPVPAPQPVYQEPELEPQPAPLVPPEEQPLPDWTPPALVLPRYMPPLEPQPIGFLRGSRPVVILDVSGTMHPNRRGQFPRVKACVSQLMEPDGEEGCTTWLQSCCAVGMAGRFAGASPQDAGPTPPTHPPTR